MFRKRLTHYGTLGLGCGVVLLCLLLLTHTQPQHATPAAETVRKSGKPNTSARGVRPPFSPPQKPLDAFQSSAFYRVIIDNNLFRPLGWTPPRPREPYRLIGTILPTDANTPKQAILQGNASQQTHIVRIGDKLDADTIVIDIQPKQVTLEKVGQQRTLKLNTTSLLK